MDMAGGDMVRIRTKTNKKMVTRDQDGRSNGFLIPIYNIHEGFFPDGCEPQQVYLTVIGPKNVKGPHLHLIRTGCFTCIKGNVRFILRTSKGYEMFHSGENHEYRTVLVPVGVPAALQNLGEADAYVLNTPYPAWTSTMNDEHAADFSDFDFSQL
jgi:dTDP-4-dehydrorhamnose 3,5-epimerase